ncbi:RidA family protein [Actinomyces lilanjuaniae]|uniref:RidA family protein n=1 Tax=Actinomyces lilanjuaniae TaxID=2321394 RepID=A0ABM6Z5W5_9ACTO|nr:Rid family detoxifying hydrolase [Actinomyces lilanjuaniae]AYD90632.1 RidA family protein [Actinomyces lilanjuaniae]
MISTSPDRGAAAPASVVATESAPAAVGPYSQAVSTGEGSGSLVFVSGQVPLDPATGSLVEGGVQVQAEQVLRNVGAILSAAGLGYADVVKTTVLLADIADFAAVNEVYARFFEGEVLPARAAFAVAALPLGARVEIEAVAVRP